MTRLFAVALLLSISCVAQAPAPTPDNQVPQRREILKNSRVVVNLVTIPPGDTTPMHKHNLDMVEVFLTAGRTQETISGKDPASEKVSAGEVLFKSAGTTHSVKNVSSAPFQSVITEFLDAQGKSKQIGKKSQTCAQDKKICVEEHELFCTEKVCVEKVNMAPGAVTLQHSHATDHMLIAVSDYELTDEVEGKGTVMRKHKSGEVEFIPAGITHRLTNKTSAPAQFVVILWR